MPAENEFVIKIKTLLEDSGIKATEDQVQNLSKSLEKGGKSAHEAALSHRELHEAAGAVARTMGGLPDIGLWINPQLIGLALLTTAYEKITEHFVELIRRHQELLDKSREIEEKFSDALPKAFAESRASTEKFEQSLRHVAAAIDTVAQAQKAAEQTNTSTVQSETSLADAEERRVAALLKIAEETGRISHEQATLLALNNEDETQRKKDQAADMAGANEVENHRRAAIAYNTRASSEHDTVDKLTPESARVQQEINRQADTVKDTQDALDAAKKELTARETELANLRATQSVLGPIGPGAALEGPITSKMADVHQAEKTVESAKKNQLAAEDHADALARHKASLDAQISAATAETLADLQKAAAEREATTLLEQKNAEEKALRDADRTSKHQTALINLAGQTPEGRAAAGLGRSELLTQIPQTIQAGTDLLNTVLGERSRGETVPGEQLEALMHIMDRLIGYIANGQTPREYLARISTLESKIQNMEDAAAANRFGPS